MVEPGAAAVSVVADASGVTVLATDSIIAGGTYQRALLAQQPTLQARGVRIQQVLCRYTGSLTTLLVTMSW